MVVPVVSEVDIRYYVNRRTIDKIPGPANLAMPHLKYYPQAKSVFELLSWFCSFHITCE
jgi:hypothetical protein